MTEKPKPLTGGCLCGQLRWEASSEPLFAGYCYCADCRKASGGGFTPFMGFDAQNIQFTGRRLAYASRSFRNTEAVRNSCPDCGGMVFGGIPGTDNMHTVYAGSLDDASVFKPTLAIFARDRPDWTPAPPEGVAVFDTMPDR